MQETSNGPSLDRRHLPNLIIAGVTKAGTTSLFWWLAQHPAISRSDVKELRYFSAIRHGRPLPPLEEYAAHFAQRTDEPYALEASPAYCYGGRPLAERIEAVLDDPRIIVCLRDPADRFVSYHAFMRSRQEFPADMDLLGYLSRCREMARTGEDRLRENFPYYAWTTGFYADYLPDWFEVFGSRLRIVFFDDLVADPVTSLRGLADWLGIDASVVDRFDLSPENQTVPVRNATLQRMALTANRRLRRFFSRHRTLKRGLRDLYLAVNADRERQERRRATSEERAILREEYADANVRLGRLLRDHGYTDLPDWAEATTDAPAADRR